jgi:hypothetical protein
MPAAATRQLYRVLGPCLGERVPDGAERSIDQFCTDTGVSGAELARVLRACRFFLRQAAAFDLSATEMGEDLAALGDTGEIQAILLPGYEAAKSLVKGEIALAALADHGKLVEHVDWRVDRVTTSNRGEKLEVPVTVVTLRYREGELRSRITLQLLPAALRELRAMCDRLL